MLDLSNRYGTAIPNKPAAGTYFSVVLKVRWAEGYPPQEAYEIQYQITGEDGTSRRHREIFKNDPQNFRTAKFEKYLRDNGLTDICEFEGCKETLYLDYKKAYDGNTYFNIQERTFVGR